MNVVSDEDGRNRLFDKGDISGYDGYATSDICRCGNCSPNSKPLVTNRHFEGIVSLSSAIADARQLLNFFKSNILEFHPHRLASVQL